LTKTLYVTFKRDKSLDSFYNRVYRPFWTLDTIFPRSSFLVLGSISLVQVCWITSCNASTRLGPPFSTARPRYNPHRLPCCSRYFSALSFSSSFGISMSTQSSLKSTGCGGCSFTCSSKCSFHLASTWFLLVNSSPFLARHIATCGSNGRRTSYRRL
jgi:hypothetical protein